MQLVLPGALPDPGMARELAPHLVRAAPTLAGWFERARAKQTPADPRISGCTPFEQWRLQAHGFEPQADQNVCAGLGPLLYDLDIDQNTPVWLAELVHVAPTQNGASLLPASALGISSDDGAALHESARSLFDGTGFALHAGNSVHWRIDLPPDYTPQCASTALISITSVNDWWPQDAQARPWRRLVNELQMLWFDHPVNLRRQENGLPSINSLWLFGGARRTQFTRTVPPDTQVHDILLDPFNRQDWGLWISSLEQLEATVFKPALTTGSTSQLVLTGQNRFVELAPAGLSRWRHWLPGSREAWRQWWSPQN